MGKAKCEKRGTLITANVFGLLASQLEGMGSGGERRRCLLICGV